LEDRATALRANQTGPERRFWQLLYTSRKSGYHFRRQAQIGPYYADFVCHHAGLIFEIDGDTHGSEVAQASDSRRTAYLKTRGYDVFRFTNNDVLTNPDGVYTMISAILQHRPKASGSPTPTPNPSPQGGGEPTEGSPT